MNNHVTVAKMMDPLAPPGGGMSVAHDAGLVEWGEFPAQTERPSLLIFSDSCHDAPAREDMAAMAAGLDMRLLDHVPIAEAAERLSHLVDVDAVLVRCSGGEAGLDLLLARLDTMASGHGMGLVVIADLEGLDHVHAIVGASEAAILCRPEPEDVIAALALVSGRCRDRQWLHDIGRESSDARIDKLSDELVRLSRTIEALVRDRLPSQFVPAHGGGDFLVHSPARSFAAWPGTDGRRAHYGISASQVRAVLRTRRLRDHLFSSDLFADPAWDILLDLMAARLEGARVSVSSLCIAAAVPPTTALRWIRQLTERGLLVRQADPNDGRRVFIALSDKGADAVARWFEESRSHLMLALGLGGDGKEGGRALD